MRGSSIWGCLIKKLAVLFVIVLAFILVPFFIFGERIENLVSEGNLKASTFSAAALLVTGLLASDIFLPVPSSIVSTFGGMVLGFLPGLIASAAGMVISCAVGYWFGALAGRPAAARLIGDEQMKRMESFHSKWGLLMIIIARPIPVLAEASVLFSGMARLDFKRFLLYSTLSNIGISAIYSAAGAYSAKLGSFVLSFAAAIILPGVLMLIARLAQLRNK